MDPRTSLKDWLKAKGIAPGTFAGRLAYDRSNFHRLLNTDTFWPSLDLAHAIDRETDGDVPMASWAEAKAAASAAQEAA